MKRLSIALLLGTVLMLGGCYTLTPECRAMVSECTKGCPDLPSSGPNPQTGWGNNHNSMLYEQRQNCMDRCYDRCREP